MVEIKSLNEAHEEEDLVYWCNSCAEIFLPNDTTFPADHTPDELPPQQRDLYLNYWTDSYSCSSYVVTYNGQPGILFTHEYDGYFFRSMLNRAKLRSHVNTEVVGDEYAVYFRSVYDEAKVLARDATFDGCVIFIGNNTDPDGHEICLFVPYEKRDKIETYLKVFDCDTVYSNVAKSVKESFAAMNHSESKKVEWGLDYRRAMELLDLALDWIDNQESESSEFYRILADDLNMADDEIMQLGWGYCIPKEKEDEDE